MICTLRHCCVTSPCYGSTAEAPKAPAPLRPPLTRSRGKGAPPPPPPGPATRVPAREGLPPPKEASWWRRDVAGPTLPGRPPPEVTSGRIRGARGGGGGGGGGVRCFAVCGSCGGSRAAGPGPGGAREVAARAEALLSPQVRPWRTPRRTGPCKAGPAAEPW